MSPQLALIIVAIPLLGHGLGHALTVFPLLGFRLSASHSSELWLLDGVVGAGIASGVCGALR